MVDYIENIGVDSKGNYGKVSPEQTLETESLVKESLEMESSYASSAKSTDYQLLRLELNGQKYVGIPDIFQSENPSIQELFTTLRNEGVIFEGMSLEDQQQVMSFLVKLSNTITESAHTNVATAFNGSENVPVTSFITPQDPAVANLASQLQSQGIITDSMTDAEKLAAITNYVNSNFSYKADAARGGWSTASNTISNGSGDCEDLAILVANLAITLGVSEDKVQVCVKGGGAGSQGHVVVGLLGSEGNLTTFDVVYGTQSTARISDFTFIFNKNTITSGDGSVGNSWVMEDAKNVNSLYTASNGIPSLSQVRTNIAGAIDSTYKGMLVYAEKLSEYTDPGALFKLQQELQTMKDMIATYTAVGKMVGDTLSEAMKSFSQSLSR